jgi:tellurite methyltransferase
MSPSPFVVEWAARVRASHPGSIGALRALDVAMGGGRHAVPLALAGFHTFGVDRRADAVRDAMHAAAGAGVALAAWCADLTQHPLPRGRFDLVVVTRYLQRDLFPALADALAPGGVVIYETFTVAQRAHGRGPTSPDHLLEAGELRVRLSMLETMFYEEVDEPEAVARLVARRRSRS